MDAHAAAVPVSPRRIAWQIAVFCVAVLLVLWKAWRLLPGPVEHKWIRTVLVGIAAAMAVSCAAFPRPSWEDLGLSARGLRSGWGSVAVFTVGCVAALLAFAALEGWHLAWNRAAWSARYVVGAALQQVALQVFLNNRLHDATGRSLRATIVLATLIMALLHAPNPPLVGAVTFVTPFWIWHFRRHRNLAAVALSHAALGCSAMFLLGKGPLLNLRVGLGALELMLD